MEICSNCFRDKSAEHVFCPWCGYPSGEIGLRRCRSGHIIFDTYKNCVFCLHGATAGSAPGPGEAVFTELVNRECSTDLGPTVLEEDTLDKTVLENSAAKTQLDIPVGGTRIDAASAVSPAFFAWLVFTDDAGVTEHHTRLPKEKCVLGKGDDVDIHIADGYASKLHALIFLENGIFYISDLGSTNGTILNGEVIMKERLNDGDKLRIGRRHIIFKQVVRDLSETGRNRHPGE